MQPASIASILGGKQGIRTRMDMIELGDKGVTKDAFLRLAATYLNLSLSQIAKLLPITERTIQRYSPWRSALLTLITVVVIVIIQEGTRRIPVQYGKRVRGRRVYGGGQTHIPLKVNTAGMISLIFAQSIVTFPAIVAGFFSGNTAVQIQDIFGNQSGFIYWFIYFWLVVGFTYFYTGVMIQNQNLGENLQKNGGFIPGIRPGKQTVNYLIFVINRITWAGALFLGLVAIMPFVGPADYPGRTPPK